MTTQPLTRKQQASFPEVATIRKGGAKIQREKDGRKYETVGPDLGDRFRVVFAPGAEDMRARFIQTYGSLEPQRIKAMIPFPSVYQAWEYYNEAYSAGRLVARADDDRFLIYRNPLTGVYEVTNGDPYREYHHGMTVGYDRGDKHYELPIKCTGRLRLWLPWVDTRLVYFTLKTTSYYDCQNISQNLAAVQAVANALPTQHGNAAGIPLWIYRMEREITWNKPDGSAQRVKKWLVQIEVDPDFVAKAFERMQQFALTGSDRLGKSLPAGEIVGFDDPDLLDEDSKDEDPAGEVLDLQANSPAAPAQPTSPDPTPAQPAVTPGAMSYEMACTVKSRTTGEFYKDLPTKSLSGRLRTKLNIRPPERTEQVKFEIDALQCILSHRYHHPEEEPGAQYVP